MNKVVVGMLALVCFVVVAGAAFTDTDIAKNHGKTGLKNLTEQIDTNFTAIEAGTEAIAGSSLGLGSVGAFSIVGTTQLVFIASGVTNVIDADITTP